MQALLSLLRGFLLPSLSLSFTPGLKPQLSLFTALSFSSLESSGSSQLESIFTLFTAFLRLYFVMRMLTIIIVNTCHAPVLLKAYHPMIPALCLGTSVPRQKKSLIGQGLLPSLACQTLYLVPNSVIVSLVPDQWKIMVWSNSYTKVVSECLDKIMNFLWLWLTAWSNNIMSAH